MVRSIIISIILSAMALLSIQAQVPFTCKGQFILTLASNGDSRLALVEVDPMTNRVTFGILNNSLGIDINAIGYRNQENLIYGIDPNRHFLYRVDAVGNVENLGRLPLDDRLSYFAADITPDGRYLVLIGGSAGTTFIRDEELVKVDLTLPGYPVERIRVSGAGSRIFDIAFNPLTEELYGFDSNNERLVRIDFNTAEVIADFPSTGNVDNAGSLFFDAFGNLFAYGGPAFSAQNRFYSVNTQTGAFEVLAGGPDAEGTDACSCPYTVEMKKIALEEWTYPCKEVNYQFIIANGSGLEQEEINFIDPLPPGMTFVEVIENPFGGVVTSNVGDPFIAIERLTLPRGIDTITARVYVGDIPEDRYFNQARLTNLPVSLGQTVLSDEPRTLAEEDSTYMDVKRIPFDEDEEEFIICSGDVVEVDLTSLGEKFEWSDGETSGRRTFAEGGNFSVLISAGCDQAIIYYTILEEDIEMSVNETYFEVRLGDTIVINPIVFNTGMEEEFTWIDPKGEVIDCGECSIFEFVPKKSGTYTVVVTNEFGCTDEVEITIIVDNSRRIFAPNAISPNFDNINDFFFIMSQDYGKIENMYIYDRWGELVYKGSNFFVNDEREGWNGLFNGEPVLPGVYVWMAEITFLDDLTEFFSGDITVIR